MSYKVRGACLCGKVSFELSGPFNEFHLCHCSQCRRSTGSAHASNIFTSPDRLKWLSGEDLVKRYIPDQAGVIPKAFCNHCGSLLPYRSLKKKDRLIVPAGSLLDPPGIEPDDNIYWADRADWYDAGLSAKHVEQDPWD